MSAADDGDFLLAFFGAYSNIAFKDRGVGWHDASASSSSIDIFTGDEDDSGFEVVSLSDVFFANSSLMLTSLFSEDVEKLVILYECLF